MINFMVWIIAGGLLGWSASMIIRTRAHQDVLFTIVVGIIGALLAGIVLSPLFGVSPMNQNNFSPSSLLIAVMGADILLGAVTVVRRGSVQQHQRPSLEVTAAGGEVMYWEPSPCI